jgi:hypothetical protein
MPPHAATALTFIKAIKANYQSISAPLRKFKSNHQRAEEAQIGAPSLSSDLRPIFWQDRGVSPFSNSGPRYLEPNVRIGIGTKSMVPIAVTAVRNGVVAIIRTDKRRCRPDIRTGRPHHLGERWRGCCLMHAHPQANNDL